MKKHLQIFSKGFVMGIAEIVPGVSASTLALVMKIYFDFISFLYQISNFLKEALLFLIFKSNLEKLKSVFKEIDLKFGVFLFLGMLLAIVSFSNLMSYLLHNYREYVLAFFFGLVLASVSVPWKEIKEKGFKEVMLVIISFVIFFLLLSLRPYEMMQAPSPFYFFFGGAIAICAMVLPGVSGSFVFLMLGLYEFIVNYISNFSRFVFEPSEVLSILGVFLGIVFGFSIFVRILKNALQNHSSVIFAVLTGIILASLRVLWPYSEASILSEILSLSLVVLLGFGVVSFLKKLG